MATGVQSECYFSSERKRIKNWYGLCSEDISADRWDDLEVKHGHYLSRGGMGMSWQFMSANPNEASLTLPRQKAVYYGILLYYGTSIQTQKNTKSTVVSATSPSITTIYGISFLYLSSSVLSWLHRSWRRSWTWWAVVTVNPPSLGLLAWAARYPVDIQSMSTWVVQSLHFLKLEEIVDLASLHLNFKSPHYNVSQLYGIA